MTDFYMIFTQDITEPVSLLRRLSGIRYKWFLILLKHCFKFGISLHLTPDISIMG